MLKYLGGDFVSCRCGIRGKSCKEDKDVKSSSVDPDRKKEK
jgi:hypothetical protein